MNPEMRLLIAGEMVSAASGSTYPNINPATEEVMGQVADAGPEHMERAIAAARRDVGTYMIVGMETRRVGDAVAFALAQPPGVAVDLLEIRPNRLMQKS